MSMRDWDSVAKLELEVPNLIRWWALCHEWAAG
jgi:hypothetical protein